MIDDSNGERGRTAASAAEGSAATARREPGSAPETDRVFSPEAAALKVGFRKTSLIDYPGRIASVIFFPGCNFRCPWCHNRELVLGNADDLSSLGECLSAIKKRSHLIQGVVLTGGEPLLRDTLGDVIRYIHGLGLPVKLDTNGSFPEELATLNRDTATRPEYVALDLKTSPDRYAELAPDFRMSVHVGDQGFRRRQERRRQREPLATPPLNADPFFVVADTLTTLIRSNQQFEVRSVVAPGFFDAETVSALADFVPKTAPWYFSAFAPGNCLNPAWNDVPPTAGSLLDDCVRRAKELGKWAIKR